MSGKDSLRFIPFSCVHSIYGCCCCLVDVCASKSASHGEEGNMYVYMNMPIRLLLRWLNRHSFLMVVVHLVSAHAASNFVTSLLGKRLHYSSRPLLWPHCLEQFSRAVLLKFLFPYTVVNSARESY